MKNDVKVLEQWEKFKKYADRFEGSVNQDPYFAGYYDGGIDMHAALENAIKKKKVLE